ncbi:DNA/RNA nuclease SfsA [Paracoccaceae bacterium GXU_MW_L88]
MKFDPPLIRATLTRRYKRFLADVILPDGRETTAHVANPGAMTGLAEEGQAIWLADVAGGGRKLDWSWKLAEVPTGLVCVDTTLSNRIVEDGLALVPHETYRREVKYGTGSRVDFLLDEDHYLEVKGVTLSRQPGLAEFPDTTTARGTKHLRELAEMVRQGKRATMLYHSMRNDAEAVTIAHDIDPAYAAAWHDAKAAGVEMIAVASTITPEEITLAKPLPLQAPPAASM